MPKMNIIENDIQEDYQSRMNRVFMYIETHLDSELSLNLLAEIAFFSPYHFHRIFKFITGETLNSYVTRQKVEKAASNLIHTSIPISEIGYRYGFKDTSSFTRTFKKFYGLSPTAFRKDNPHKFSKIRQVESKNGQDYPDHEKYICIITNLKNWIQMNAHIEIRKTPMLAAAAVTHIGAQGIENAFEKLIKWGNSKGLLRNAEARMGRIFYDSFKVTSPDKVRMSVLLTTNEVFEVDGAIEKISIPQGNCIVGRFEITPLEFEKSWSGLFIWMSENGYKKSIEHPYEIYHNDFREHPENKMVVDFYIPIS
jgi:AraC family transcriptional regulator